MVRYAFTSVTLCGITSQTCFECGLIYRITHEGGQTICGLAWNPKGNKEIAYTDNQVNKIVFTEISVYYYYNTHCLQYR